MKYRSKLLTIVSSLHMPVKKPPINNKNIHDFHMIGLINESGHFMTYFRYHELKYNE